MTNRYPMLEGFKKLKQVQQGPWSPRCRVQEALASCTVQDSCQLLSSFEAPNDSPTAGTESARMSEMVRLWILGNLGINLNFKHRDSEDDARSLVRWSTSNKVSYVKKGEKLKITFALASPGFAKTYIAASTRDDESEISEGILYQHPCLFSCIIMTGLRRLPFSHNCDSSILN